MLEIIKKDIFIKILMIVILFIGIQYVIAGEVPNSDEIAKQISNNVSEEFVTCAAYYSFASEGLRRSGDLESALKVIKTRDAALEYALISAKEGRTQKMAEKVTRSRYELEVKSIGKEIDHDISNFSILINNYASRCKEIMENPEIAINEWTEKIFKRHKSK